MLLHRPLARTSTSRRGPLLFDHPSLARGLRLDGFERCRRPTSARTASTPPRSCSARAGADGWPSMKASSSRRRTSHVRPHLRAVANVPRRQSCRVARAPSGDLVCGTQSSALHALARTRSNTSAAMISTRGASAASPRSRLTRRAPGFDPPQERASPRSGRARHVERVGSRRARSPRCGSRTDPSRERGPQSSDLPRGAEGEERRAGAASCREFFTTAATRTGREIDRSWAAALGRRWARERGRPARKRPFRTVSTPAP